MYGDIVDGVIDVQELDFLVKHMEGMVRKWIGMLMLLGICIAKWRF